MARQKIKDSLHKFMRQLVDVANAPVVAKMKALQQEKASLEVEVNRLTTHLTMAKALIDRALNPRGRKSMKFQLAEETTATVFKPKKRVVTAATRKKISKSVKAAKRRKKEGTSGLELNSEG